MLYIKGTAIEEILNGINIQNITKAESTLIYSVFDKMFDYTSVFVSGAPSAHLVVESRGGTISGIFYLDLKSVTFSFSPEDTLDRPIPEDLLSSVKKAIWKNSTVLCTKTPSIEFVIDDINFFSDYNINILGIYSTSKDRFDEICSLSSKIPFSFTQEETSKTHSNAILINMIAVESSVYEMDNNHYIVPNVGMEGLELWLGTNPRFFLDIADEHDDDAKKLTKKYLYNIIFSRIAKALSEHFSVSHYSVSKVEKAFVIEHLEQQDILEFLRIVKEINCNARDIFFQLIENKTFNIGLIEQNTQNRLDLLKTFYDEKNIIGIITAAFSDEDSQHRQILENLINKDIPRMIKIITQTTAKIDTIIKTCIEDGRKNDELY